MKKKYIYHLAMLIEKIVSYFVILILAVIFRSFVHTFFFLFFFSNIRKHSGGFHLSNFYSCFFTSIGLYIVFVKGVYPYFYKNTELLAVGLLIALIIILYIGAVNNENINWSVKEFRENRKIVRCMSTIEVFIITILGLMGMGKSYLIYMAFGVLLSAILLLLERIRVWIRLN